LLLLLLLPTAAPGIPCSHISPRAVANTDDPAAALVFEDTTFFNNRHAGSTNCYWHSSMHAAWVECYTWKVGRYAVVKHCKRYACNLHAVVHIGYAS
jgi:hypothetical protein